MGAMNIYGDTYLLLVRKNSLLINKYYLADAALKLIVLSFSTKYQMQNIYFFFQI